MILKDIYFIKSQLIFVFLFALIISIVGISSVEAEPKGRNLIKERPSSADLPLKTKEHRKTSTKLEDPATSDAEKAFLEDQLDSDEKELKAWFKNNSDPKKKKAAREKHELLIEVWDSVLDDKVIGDDQQEMSPITSIGYDHIDNALEVTIEPMMFNDKNIKKYIKQIRKIIGDEIDLTIAPNGSAEPDSCGSRTEGDCKPLKGGVLISAGVHDCTIGFRASLDGKVGFATVGHCFNSKVGVKVRQPMFTGKVIGTIVKERYFHRTICDCGFAETTREMSNKIFGLGKTIDGLGFLEEGVSIKISGGVSGIQRGSITDISRSLRLSSGVLLLAITEADYPSQFGDSGSPVYSKDGTKLMGIHSSADNRSNSLKRRYFYPATRFESEFSNLDFEWLF